jgi:hypothetical protein
MNRAYLKDPAVVSKLTRFGKMPPNHLGYLRKLRQLVKWYH